MNKLLTSVLVSFCLALSAFGQDPGLGSDCDHFPPDVRPQDAPGAESPTISPYVVDEPLDHTRYLFPGSGEGADPWGPSPYVTRVADPTEEEGNTDLDILIALYPGEDEDLSDAALAGLEAQIAALGAEIARLEAEKAKADAERAAAEAKRQAYHDARDALLAFRKANPSSTINDPAQLALRKKHADAFNAWTNAFPAWERAAKRSEDLKGKIASAKAEQARLQAELAKRKAERAKREGARRRHGSGRRGGR